jgi:Arc/MetJ-type ribon-helix-helix transcriptional regulator
MAGQASGPRRKVAVTLEPESVAALDRLVAEKAFPSRSQAVQEAIDSLVAWKTGHRLAAECAKLDPAEEVALAEEGLAEEASEWPEY